MWSNLCNRNKKIICETQIEKKHIKEKYFIKVKIPEHHIIDINDTLCELLLYNKEEVIGQVVHELFTNTLFQKNINKFFTIQDKSIQNMFRIAKRFSKQISKLRFIPLIKKDDTILWVKTNPYVYIHQGEIYAYVLLTIYDEQYKIAPNIPERFLKYINSPSSGEFYVDDFKDCIIIMMDIYKSTELTLTKTSMEMAQIYHQIIKKSNYLINHEFFPFIQFVEACGDSLMFIHSPELMLPLNDILLEVINFSLLLTTNLNQYLNIHNVHIRCGISYGNISGGIIDGKTMRWFGRPIHKASRLESKCIKNNIVIDDIIYNKLIEQKNFILTGIQEEKCDLKGFGECIIYYINNEKDSHTYLDLIRPAETVVMRRKSNDFFL